jgi:hypothetical protein
MIEAVVAAPESCPPHLKVLGSAGVVFMAVMGGVTSTLDFFILIASRQPRAERLPTSLAGALPPRLMLC